MGQPKITRRELLEDSDLSDHEIRGFLEPGANGDADVYMPVARTWCMGFAWSSWVAQTCMMAICSKSGLRTDQLLSEETPTPSQMSSTFALATDDIMLFSNRPPHYTEADRVTVSEQMEESGVARNMKKDVAEQEDGVCIGANLRAGRHWEAPAERVWDTIAGAIGFLAYGLDPTN